MINSLVFDFDGLILETEMAVYVAWREEFIAHGAEPPTIEEWGAEVGTVNGLDLVGLLHERATSPVDEPVMHKRRQARHDELIDIEIVRPGVEAWLDEADERGLPIAIASSSPRDWVEGHLGRLGLRDRFRYVACFDAGVAAKPAPDTYLAACRALGVEPAFALAIEDSANGVRAAKAAGMWCVVVPHAITEGLDLSAADVRVDSLATVTLAEVLAQLAVHNEAREEYRRQQR